MLLHVVVVRDRAADVFGAPNFVASVGGAIRAFGDEINRSAENNAFYAHPEDFDLYKLGMYDDSTGLFDCGLPAMIAIGKDMRISK